MFAWIKSMLCREPDLIVGGADNPYLLRWYLIPRNRLFNIYLHKFVRDDDDRALHDHPWASLSIVLSGGYFDITDQTPDGSEQRRWYGVGSIIPRRSTSRHRVELAGTVVPVFEGITLIDKIGDGNRPAWTLFLTGPRVREWGFHCPGGWRHWREFTAGKNGETVGKGCD